jgi:hypothetical protein
VRKFNRSDPPIMMRPSLIHFNWLVLLLLCVNAGAADPIQLPVTQDNSIIMVDGEWSENAGQQGRIRIKGNQHIVAMAFDLSGVVGKRVKKATLACYQGENVISGVTLSTIATPWSELRSTGMTAGLEGLDGWGYPGARFPALAGGNSFTLAHHVTSPPRDGQYYWDVPPDFVHAMAIGVAHGIAIHEDEADYSRNPTIFSREQGGKKPRLLVELDDQVDPLPLPATMLTIVDVEADNARLSLTAPAEGFAYDVMIDGLSVGRHNIPLVAPGRTQLIPLRDLPASIKLDVPHRVEVVTLNRSGQRSSAASVTSVLGNSRPVPKPSVAFALSNKPLISNVSVLPVTDKYDLAGEPVGDLPDDYRTRNAIYDGQRVRLVAAAGEVVGFQLLLRGETSVSVEVALNEPATRIDLQQAVYVPAAGRMIPDPLLPMPDQLSLTTTSDTSIFADIFIPFDSQPGIRTGSIAISDGRTIPLEIEVLPFSIPRRASFLCEMNSYGLPDRVEVFNELQRIAYDHRVHANVLHYSHNTAAPGSRKSNLDMRLPSGRRMDNKRYDDIQPGAKAAFWDDFTTAFGPYIDGSLFANGHRGPIAAPGFYLTFHESWPLHCREYFNGDLDAYRAFVESPVYAETYVSILRDFALLAKKNNWNETGFHVYLNNKGSLDETKKAPWILDEPASFWDYRALQFYGQLSDRGRADAANLQIDFRVDISRPEYCRGQLDNRDDLWVVSSSAFKNYRRLVTDRLSRDGLKAWIYGTSNHVHETNRNIQAWALDAWLGGATGIVPWQTIDKSGNALKAADQLGIFIFDTRPDGEITIHHSTRLKAYREAQQLIEYLIILKQRRNWSAEQVSRFVAQYVEIDSEVRKTNEADAGTSAYARLSAPGLDTLKLAIVEVLASNN